MEGISVIDLTFISKNLNNKYINHFNWKIDPTIHSGSDHEIIFFDFITSQEIVFNPVRNTPYNLEKVDWKLFSEKINKFNLENKSELDLKNISEESLEKEALL